MRVLFLVHSHPDLQAGGTEIFARDLFRTLRGAGHDGLFVAGTAAHQRGQNPGTAFQTVGDRADELLLWTGGFDTFHLAQVDTYGIAPALRDVLLQTRPDIVHFHHVMTIGVEAIGLVRRFAPEARIALTLHDYYPICAHDGQMVTTAGSLCRESSVDACHRCFPERSITDFRLRELHIRGAFEQVDHFIAPSQFLLQRYVDWGLPAHKITFIPNGLPQVAAAPATPSRKRRDRFGFFGHFNRFKGATVALEASAILSRKEIEHSLVLHGSTAYQSEETVARFKDACSRAPAARCHGSYRRTELPQLLSRIDWVLFPSIWWENAPLVICEALQNGRPVICSDVGGAAEFIKHEVNGLHFPVGDPRALAEVMERVVADADVWPLLTGRITPPLSIEECARRHVELYDRLADRRDGALAA